MPIVIDEMQFESGAEPDTRSASAEQTRLSSTTSQSNVVEVEKALRQMLERLARVRAS